MKRLFDNNCNIIEYPYDKELSEIYSKLLKEYSPQDVNMYVGKLFGIELYKWHVDRVLGGWNE